MKYKALISDVDGTLVPNHEHGRLSQKVIDAVAKAKDSIHIGVATARPYRMLEGIAQTLQLSGPSVIHGGAQIMDLNTRHVYRQHALTSRDLQKIYDIATKFGVELYADSETESYVLQDAHDFKSTILGSYTMGLESEEADALVSALSDISTIVAVKISSWIDGKFDVSIGPAQATKQHGVLEVAEILGISTDEIICIGDSYNDFPLLMAAGLKVAIGNAVPELKAIADYVAPSVEDDGLVDVIEKFVLS